MYLTQIIINSYLVTYTTPCHKKMNETRSTMRFSHMRTRNEWVPIKTFPIKKIYYPIMKAKSLSGHIYFISHVGPGVLQNSIIFFMRL